MKLKIIETHQAPAQVIMDLDAQLLKDLDDTPILHLYSWAAPSATHGHFLKPADFLKQDAPINLGRRPTGGGIIFHVWDWAFSILIPSSHPLFSENNLDNYRLINEPVKSAVQSLLSETPHLLPQDPIPRDEACRHFCMAKPTIYDVMIGHQKVAGAAQRRKRQGFLHQGSISVAHPDPDTLQQTLLPGTQVFDAMQQNTFSLLGRQATPSEIEDARAHIRTLVTTAFQESLR